MSARVPVIGLLALLAMPAAADESPLLWRIDGTANVVFLMGSVHMLRPSDYPLGEPLEAAYREAESLVMELDLDDLDPLELQSWLLRHGISAERSLEDALGAEAYRRAEREAADLGFDLGLLSSAEPWFAALTLLNLQMAKLGFDPGFGIESHFASRATADGKAIEGLETPELQLSLFDRMPLEVQREFLLKTLEDASSLPRDLERVIAAGKRGDHQELERELLRGFEEFPSVYRTLVVDRNARWVERIEELLEQPGDVLVVVGSLHLLGDPGVVKLLERKGYRLERSTPRDY